MCYESKKSERSHILMPYAIELYLGDEGSAKINEIRSELKRNKINIDEGTKPHVSLSIYEDIPIVDFEKELNSYAKRLKTFEVIFSHVGEFITDKPVIFLEPKITPELLDVHKKFHHYFSKYDDLVWE